MNQSSDRAIIAAALHRYPRTFAEELGRSGLKNTPSSLYRLLCFAHLASTRIRHDIALHATRALLRQGWTTPRKMAQASWAQRVRVLNQAGYARYDESTATRLGENAVLLLERYRGDLRQLRDQADRDPTHMRQHLKSFKGIGDVGVDIFFRDAQVVWDELFPFADRVAQRSARAVGLPDDARKLARLTGPDRVKFVRLLAALVRIELQKEHAEVRRAAA